MKDVSTSVCTATQPFATLLVSANLPLFKHELIWEKEKSAAFAIAKYRPLPVHENIYIFGQRIVYNPQMVKREKPRFVGRKPKHGPTDAFGGIPAAGRVSAYSFPRSVLKMPRHTGLAGIHFTQKPVELLRYLIRSYSNPGDTILDPTAGSGTTAVAALLEGRNSICIEKDPVIFANAKERVMAVQRSLRPRSAAEG